MDDQIEYQLFFIDPCIHCHTEYGVNPCHPTSRDLLKCKSADGSFWCTDITKSFSSDDCFAAINGKINHNQVYVYLVLYQICKR